MASPQRLTTALRSSVSPCAVQRFSGIRQLLSPRSPTNERLSPNNCVNKNNEGQIPCFNIDTPNRMRMLEAGLGANNRGSVIGIGAYGTVYKASYKGSQVAAKLVKTRKYTDEVINAEKHAALLRHANIVKILRIEEGPCLSLIAMELCGTSLQDRLDETELTAVERVRILLNITRALQFCHKAGIVHADVKPKNVLMGTDGQPKLTDFGSSVLIGEPRESHEIRGTPGYIAPEVLKGDTVTPAADIYSLGVVAWQMLTRELPFSGLHIHAVIYLSAKGTRPEKGETVDGFDGHYRLLYRRMWSQNAKSRPTIEWIVEKASALLGNEN